MSHDSEQPSSPRPQEERLREELERLDATLRRVSQELFEHPELSGEERRACALLAGLLSQDGFDVDASIADLPTAFLAKHSLRRGGSPRIGLFCEYDALPGLGHACGHNLIASASLVAGLALAKGLDAERGEVWVIGSPAEETFGGKVALLRSGRLKGLDAAMMFHPGPETRVRSLISVATEPTEIVFYSEHLEGLSNGFPSNPVLAVASLFQSIATAASRLAGDVRFPGVIIEGGERPNVVPVRTVARFSFRARSRTLLRRFMSEVLVCVRGAARTSGCSFSMRRYEAGYEPILVNETMGQICEEYLRGAGLAPLANPPEAPGAYDIGNVSRHIPVIHPIISKGFEGISTHTDEFRARAGSEEGIECAIVAARVLALTGMRLFTSSDLLAVCRQELEKPVMFRA
ncbi:MAG: amidohydrolase [Candidatus Coatesbacteria bacterium]|nr:amidohydrolase [Candidatus Coatesbacteria bacterium]